MNHAPSPTENRLEWLEAGLVLAVIIFVIVRLFGGSVSDAFQIVFPPIPR